MAPLKSIRVLIVEDSPDDTLLVVNELKRGDFIPVYKRVETKEQFRQELVNGWDVIFVDYALPGFGGVEALDILNEDGLDIPLIIISGSITEEVAVPLLKNGAKDFITKNNLSRLVPAVERELGESFTRKKQKILEAQIAWKDEQINTFFNSANEPFILLDSDFRFVHVNPSYERRVGLTNEQLRGRKISEITPDIESSGRLIKYADVIKTGKPVSFSHISAYSPILGERIVNVQAFKVGDGLGLIVNDITEVSKYEKRLEALHEHALKLSSAGNIEEISKISLDVMFNLFNFHFISYLIVVDSHLIGVQSRGAPLAGLKLSIDGKGITAKAARTRNTVLVNDLREDPDFVRGSTESLSELAVPVVVDGATVAVLNAESEAINAFTEHDAKLLELLASHVASAIHRIKSQEQLIDAERVTKTIMNEVPDSVYLVDIDNNVIEVNENVTKTFGYTRSELIGRNTLLFEPPKFHENFAKLRENLLKTGHNLFESEIFAKNGEMIPVEVSTRLITYKGKSAVIGVARDLRERRRQDAKLRESEELYRTILENAPNPISITVDGKIVYANPSRMRLSGVKFEEMAGRAILDYVHPDDVHRIIAQNNISVKESGPPWMGAVRIRKNDGTYAYIESTSTPTKFKGQQALLHVFHDVTHQRRYEERLARLHDYARNLATATTLVEAAEFVGKAVQGMIETSFGSIGVVEGDNLRFLHIYGVDWDKEGVMPINGSGITTRAVRTGVTQLIHDVDKDKDYFLSKSDFSRPRSEVVVPIKVDQKVVAVINVEDTHLDAYGAEEVRLLEILGNHFSSAIQRIRNAESLLKSEESYRNLFESVSDAIYITDLSGRILNVNVVAEKTLGYSRSELLSMNVSDIDFETDPIRVQTRRGLVKSAGHGIFETQHVAKDGTRIDIEINAQTIDYNGTPAILSVCRNITERRRYINQLNKLHQYAINLSQATDVNAVYDITFKEMKNTFIHRRGNLLILKDDILYDRNISGYTDSVKWRLPLSGKGITVKAANTGKTVYVADVLKDPDYINASPDVNTRSEIAVPIKIQGKVVAVLNLERGELDAFTEAEKGLLEIMANHTSSALIRLEQVEALKEYEKRLIALNECVSKLAVAENENQVWEITLDIIERELKHDFAAIGIVSNDYLEYIRYLDITPSRNIRLPLDGPGITVRAIRTGKTQLVNDIRKDESFIPFDAGNGRPIQTLSELVTPITVEGTPYAVINIENMKADAFNETDKSLLEILAKHVEETLNRIRYIDALQEEEHQMANLHKFTHQLTTTNTAMEACVVAVDSLKTLFNATNGSVSLVEDDFLKHKYVYGVELEEEFIQPLSGRGITVRAVKTGEPQLVPDVLNDPDYMIPIDVNMNTRSELAVPVKVGGRVTAVLNIESPHVNIFTERDQSLLEILSMHLSSTFSRIEQNESKERYRSRLETLNQFVSQLNVAQSHHETAIIIRDIIHNLSPFEHARLALIEGDHLSAVVVPGDPQKITRLPLSGKGITVKAVKTRKTIYIPDTTKDKDFMKGSIETLSELVVPLFIENEVIGVLNIESTIRNAFTPDDIKLVETVAQNVASTLQRIRINAERFESQIQLRRIEYEAEQAKELERMKTRFISTATHEIRTPLTSIKGYTELIQGELENGDIDAAKRYFNVVGRNVDRLINLTDDLLDTQRIEEGRLTLNMAKCSIKELLDDLVTDMTPLLSRRKQTLSLTNKIRGTIYGDRNRLMQVLVNLITNASKFSPEKSTITLTAERRGGDAFFSVRDTGIGLTEEEMPRLFKPFPGIHVEGNPGGTGLGLSISKGIVEMHSGRIWAESEGRGTGATFNFTIPEEKE